MIIFPQNGRFSSLLLLNICNVLLFNSLAFTILQIILFNCQQCTIAVLFIVVSFICNLSYVRPIMWLGKYFHKSYDGVISTFLMHYYLIFNIGIHYFTNVCSIANIRDGAVYLIGLWCDWESIFIRVMRVPKIHTWHGVTLSLIKAFHAFLPEAPGFKYHASFSTVGTQLKVLSHMYCVQKIPILIIINSKKSWKMQLTS